jgi:hypothetical protein
LVAATGNPDDEFIDARASMGREKIIFRTGPVKL